MNGAKLKQCRTPWRATARSLVALTMMLSASACATLTGGRSPASEPAGLSPFCARWPDAARPPIEIWPGDSAEEQNQKIDLLIVWEVACGIERG